jgi:phosphoserine phosphatase
MMETAGLGIAFHAKPKVQALAPTRLNSESLLDVMYILGFTREEIDEALKR